MGRIKSALEIALERTESVKGDRESIANYEAKQNGKKLANSFLENDGVSLEAELGKTPKDEQDFLKQGLFDLLVSRINLPVDKDDERRVEKAGQGLAFLLGKSQFTQLYGKFLQLMSRYLTELEELEQAIIEQYGPKLRQKEEEIFRRLGQRLQLDPFQDPEFVAFYNQHINAHKEKYQAVVEEVRGRAREFFPSH